jgi:hypothetical protein
MKISDLAALVTVRNHILTVINDKSVTNRDEFQPLNKVRIALDKKFVDIVKSFSYEKDEKIEANVDGIFPNELTIVKVGGNGYSPTAEDLEQWRAIFEEAQNDPDFKIFTHDAINVTQLEVGPNSEFKVRPAVEPRTIEVSPNVSVVKKGQLSLPLDIDVPQVPKVEAVEAAREGSGRSGDLDTTKKQVQHSIETMAQGDVDKLEEKLDKLENQGVKLTQAVVEDAVQPIQAPVEKKKKIVKKAEEAQTTRVEDDPEFRNALQKAKSELKQQGRSNKKVARKNDETG